MRLLMTVVTIAASISLPGFGNSTRSWAQADAIMRTDPTSLQMQPGETQSMAIVVEDVTDLYGFECRISFDPAVLEVVDADPAEEGVQVAPGDFLSPDWTLLNAVDNNSGTIDYALAQLSPSDPKSGGGILLTIRFQAKASGTSPVVLRDVLLGSATSQPITVNLQDGQVVVTSGEPVAPASPTPTSGAALPSTPSASPSVSQLTHTPLPTAAETTQVPATPTVTSEGPVDEIAPATVEGADATPIPTVSATRATEATTAAASATPPLPLEGTATEVQPEEAEELLDHVSGTPASQPGQEGVSRGILVIIALACAVLGVVVLGAGLVIWRRDEAEPMQ